MSMYCGLWTAHCIIIVLPCYAKYTRFTRFRVTTSPIVAKTIPPPSMLEYSNYGY